VLATIDPDGAPHQTAMWYVLEGDEILFNTATGRRKDTNLMRDPRVSLLVEDGEAFVRVTGRARAERDRATTEAEVRRLAVRYDGEAEAEALMRRQYTRESRVSYRFRVERVYSSDELR
jgi:PPOX class probable F420-dependent enzyme